MKLSAVVVAHNEEPNIARCLASLAFADELVVVDAGSDDRTVEIARQFDARILERKWDGFATQKQFAIDAARGQWILLVDSDEEVSPELAREIQHVLSRDPAVVGFRLWRRNQFLGRWIRYGPWSSDYEIRLFRRGRGRIARKPVHEGILIDGEFGILEGLLNHYTHRTLSESFTRLNRYTTLEASDRVDKRRIRLIDAILPPAGVFLRYYFVKGCWREGVRGFLLSATTAMYKSVLYLKIRFLQQIRHVS